MPSSIGIYIGTESLDVVQLSGSFSRPHLIGFGSAKLPTQCAWRGLVRMEGPVGVEQAGSTSSKQEGPEPVGNILRSVLSRLRISAPKAHIAVAPESVVVRYFQMPAIPAHERRPAIAFEAKKYLPFKLEDLVTDHRAVVRRSDPTLMRVMFFAIKRAALTAYNTLFQAASVTPLSLEPASLSLVRLVRQNGQLAPGQVCVILSLERDTATISIARDDLLYLSRNVTILSPTEALGGSAGELLEALVTETRISVDYYRRRFLGEPAVGKILLFGKTVDPARMDELSHALELPVEIGQPFRGIAGVKETTERPWVAAGLALRGLEKRAGEINLLLPEQRAWTQGLLKPAFVEAIAALLVLGIWFGLSLTDLQNLQQKIDSVRAYATPPGVSVSSSFDQLEEKQDSLAKQVRFLKTVSSQEASPPRLLYEIADLLPGEAWLNSAVLVEDLDPTREPDSFRHRFLRLQGSAFSGDRDAELEKVNAFLTRLRESTLFKAGFSGFSLDSVKRGTFASWETTDFVLTCTTRSEDVRIREPISRRAGRPRP